MGEFPVKYIAMVILLINENGISELGFATEDKAIAFTKISLLNSQWFISDEDRFAMQYIADLIHFSIDTNILNFDDLLTTETKVIEKLKGNSKASKKWIDYQQISSVSNSQVKPKNQ